MYARWIGLAVWMLVILFNSSIPGAPIPATGILSILLSKLGHVTEYAVLAALLWACLVLPAGGVGISPRLALLLVPALGLGFAGLDELRQAFVIGRGASGWDVLLDFIAATGTAALLRRAASTSRRSVSNGQ